MKKAWLIAGALTITSIIPTAAVAQSGEQETKTQFVTLDAIEIDGARKGAHPILARANKQAKFERLSKLKKSMLPEVMATVEDQSL